MVETEFCEFGGKNIFGGSNGYFFMQKVIKNFILIEKNKFTNLIVISKYDITI